MSQTALGAPRVLSLDVLRAIAVIGVMAVHYFQWMKPSSAWLQFIASIGSSGVILFYLLSPISLLLAYPKLSDLKGVGFQVFLIRRFFRIAPMFYLAFVASLIALGFSPQYWAPDGITWKQLVLTPLFLHGLLPETVNSAPPGSWSVAVEMSFYLFFPILVVNLKTFRRCFWAFLASVLLAMMFEWIAVGLLASHYPESRKYLLDEWASYMSLPAQLPVFILGIAVYRGFFERQVSTRIVAALLMATGVLAFAVDWLPKSIFAGAISGLLLLVIVSCERLVKMPRVLVHVGVVSYSVYLLHFFVIGFLKKYLMPDFVASNDLTTLAVFVAVVVASVGVATVSFKIIEQPLMQMGRRFSNDWKGRSAVAIEPQLSID